MEHRIVKLFTPFIYICVGIILGYAWAWKALTQ